MTTYKWKVTNEFYGLGEYRTHSSYKTETKRDAESIAREYVSKQKGYLNLHMSTIYQIKTGRLRSVFYQDSFIGRIIWRSEAMDKTGHDRDLDRFTSETFKRLIDCYHKIFDLESRPPFRKLRLDLPSVSSDPDTLESLRADLPAGLVNMYIASLYMDDLILYDAAGAVFDLLEQEYRDGLGLFLLLTDDLQPGVSDQLPWGTYKIFGSKKEVIETAKAYKIKGQTYRLTPETDLDFRGSK